MDLLARLNDALDYVEDNLEGQVKVEEAARLATFSTWHFTRIFAAVAGVPLGEYVRRRRLTQAALALAAGGSVTQVALQYGCESPTAFTRAFKALHGIAPAQAKKQGSRLVAYPRISFQISIKGEKEMVYRIEERPAFTVAGKKQRMITKNEQNLKAIPEMWAAFTKEDERVLCGVMSDARQPAMLGVCANMAEGAFDYYIGVVTEKPAPEGYELLQVPATTWAVFESSGPMPEAIQDVWRRIWSEWLPASGYTLRETLPEIELYPRGDIHDADYRCEVWMPVQKA